MCWDHLLKTSSDWHPRNLVVVIVGSLHDELLHNLSNADSKGGKRHVVEVSVVLAVVHKVKKKSVKLISKRQ